MGFKVLISVPESGWKISPATSTGEAVEQYLGLAGAWTPSSVVCEAILMQTGSKQYMSPNGWLW